VERAKSQATTKFLSHAGENVSRKSRKPAQLKAYSLTDYQLITKYQYNGQYIADLTQRTHSSNNKHQPEPCIQHCCIL